MVKGKHHAHRRRMSPMETQIVAVLVCHYAAHCRIMASGKHVEWLNISCENLRNMKAIEPILFDDQFLGGGVWLAD